MSRPIVFPYNFVLREGGRIDLFPAAEIKLPNAEGSWITMFFLIDSGAAISALPKADAAELGINVEQGRKTSLRGFGPEQLVGWQHDLRARLGDHIIRFPVVFVDNDAAPRVLGRAGIFDSFTIVFEEHRRRTGFLDPHTDEAQAISTMLDNT